MSALFQKSKDFLNFKSFKEAERVGKIMENTTIANVQESAEVKDTSLTVSKTECDDNKDFIANLTSAESQFCSLVPTNDVEGAILFNAMNNPDKRIGECINEVINIHHIYCEVVECTNRETGEVQKCPRVVLIDDKGISYQAVSIGVYSAVKKLLQVFGMPESWSKPKKVKVIQITKAEKKMLTLNLVA